MNHLKVLTPCTMKYDDLEKVDDSCRFCHQCNKKVYDFTAVTQEEFMKTYTAHNGEVCALIQNKKPNPSIGSRINFVSKWAAFFVSILSFIGLSSCKSDGREEVLGEVAPIERLVEEDTTDNGKSEAVVGKISVEAPIDTTDHQ